MQAEDEERTYMNVQPVAVVGRNGKLLKPGEVRNPAHVFQTYFF